MASSTTMEFSDEHSTPWSNVLPAMTSCTAFLTFAERSMYAGALPGPTPYAGLPALYAARTRPMPPVGPRNDADRLHWTNEPVDLFGAEQVLLNLVFDHPVAGLFDGKAGEGFGLCGRRRRHRVDDRVDALLTQFGELEPGLSGALRERSSLR